MLGKKNKETVTIVTVSYNSVEVLNKMLASVPKEFPVVVVDNYSDHLEDLRKLCIEFGASLVENSVNSGFGSACNSGAALATTEFIFFVNPDCILENDTVDELISAARHYPISPAFNPRIMLDDGKPSFNYKSALLPRSKWMQRGWPNGDKEVSILSGCAMFVRRADFVAVGGFDENLFLYHEDDDLALRLNERGPIMFIFNALITHSVGLSSGNMFSIATFKAWHLGYSRAYAKHKHALPFALSSTFIWALCKAFLPDVLLSRHKREKRWSYLKGVSSGIATIMNAIKFKELKRRFYLDLRSLVNNSSETFIPHGIPVNIPVYSDTAIRYLLARGRPYEESEAKMIRAHLDRDTNVVELGGCFGVISALIREKIGPNAYHLIVEANPKLAAVCSVNASKTQHRENTEIIIAAVDYSGKKYVHFAFGNNAHCGHVAAVSTDGILTPTVTLSGLAQRIPDGPFALICDIEGAEEDLFKKEKGILSRLSLLILETHPQMYAGSTATQLKILNQIISAGMREVERSENVICFKPQ